VFQFESLEPRKVLAAIVPGGGEVVDRFVFFNDSAFDGNNAAASAADDNAIATNKTALLGGETANYENITNFVHGINGIIVDANLADPNAFSADDILLSAGIGNQLSDFSLLDVQPEVSVRIGEGVNGSDRITIILPNGSVTNEFLQVQVLANATTGLAQNDVFYFGNVVGDTGNRLTDTFVDGADVLQAQANLSGLFVTESVESNFDINRDAQVDGADVLLIQANLSPLFSAAVTITAPENPEPPVPEPTLPEPTPAFEGTEFFVSSEAEIADAISQAEPGDAIVLRNGTYTDFDIEFYADGEEGRPLTFRAETPGQVTLTGTSKLFISGDYLVVDGLNFDGGALQENDSVVEFRRRDNSGHATNSRFTNSQIINYNPPDQDTRYHWVRLYGQNNRVDNNTFSGQNHSGVTVVIIRDTPQADFHRIDNNHFLDRPPGNSNGFESIRLGESDQSLSDSFSIVENNLFERTDGEIEIISVKSGSNIIRNNTFLESAGTLTLRHGNNNVVEGNYFIGNGKDRSGGIRVIGEGHTIVNNYFEGLDGRARGAIAIEAGGVDPPLNGHAQVKDVLIANNTIVNLNDGAAIYFSNGLGNDNGAGERTLLAQNVTIVNNLISNTGDALFGGVEGSGFEFESNIAFGASLGVAAGTSGISTVNPQVSQGADGLFRLTPSSPAIDAAFAEFASATEGIDIDGQIRGDVFDIGADEFSTAPILDGPLSGDDVGHNFEVSDAPPTSPSSATDPNNDGDTFTVVSSSDSFGGTSVIAPDGDRVNSPSDQDALLTYDLQFAEAGTYTAYYRARGADGGSNSFYTPGDFGADPSVSETLSSDGNYRWETGDTFQVSASDINSTLEFSIGKREAGAELNVVVFHLNGNLSSSQLDALFA